MQADEAAAAAATKLPSSGRQKVGGNFCSQPPSRLSRSVPLAEVYIERSAIITKGEKGRMRENGKIFWFLKQNFQVTRPMTNLS